MTEEVERTEQFRKLIALNTRLTNEAHAAYIQIRVALNKSDLEKLILLTFENDKLEKAIEDIKV